MPHNAILCYICGLHFNVTLSLSLLGYIVTPDLQPISNSLQLGYNHLFSSHWSLVKHFDPSYGGLHSSGEGKSRWENWMAYHWASIPWIVFLHTFPYVILPHFPPVNPPLPIHLEFQPLETMFTVPSHTTVWLKFLLMRTLPLRSENVVLRKPQLFGDTAHYYFLFYICHNSHWK